MFDREWHPSRATLFHAQHDAVTFSLSMATNDFRCAVIYIFTQKLLNFYQKHFPLAFLDKCWRVTGITHFVAFTTTELNAEKYRTSI